MPFRRILFSVQGIPVKTRPELIPIKDRKIERSGTHLRIMIIFVVQPDVRCDKFITLVIPARTEEHTSELQSQMRNTDAVFCLKKKNILQQDSTTTIVTSK